MLGTLTGGTQAKAAGTAAGAYRSGLSKGFETARPELLAGYEQAQGALGTGLTNAQNAINNNLYTAHVALNGGSTNAADYYNDYYGRALDRVNSGFDKATAATTDRYNMARDAVQSGLLKIADYYKPYIQSGTAAQGLYDNALGVNGAGAAQQFYQDYGNNDPFRAFRDEMANKALLAQANAAGVGGVGGFGNIANGAGGGRTAAAISRASLERGTQDLNTYLDRLAAQSARGGQYAGQAAQLTDAGYGRIAGFYGQEGDRLAELGARQGITTGDILARQGGALAGLEQQHGQTLANIYTGAGNNLANLAMQAGTQGANLYAQQGNTLANLDYGYNQQLATNDANAQMAKGAAAQQGMNNLLQLGSLAAQAYTGMPLPRGSTQPGTLANGGWSTTTTPTTGLQRFFG